MIFSTAETMRGIILDNFYYLKLKTDFWKFHNVNLRHRSWIYYDWHKNSSFHTHPSSSFNLLFKYWLCKIFVQFFLLLIIEVNGKSLLPVKQLFKTSWQVLEVGITMNSYVPSVIYEKVRVEPFWHADMLCFNRYRTVWRFKGHANFRTRIFVEKWEAE